jgi:hypothetical protein
VLVVSVFVSSNTLSDDRKSVTFSNLAGYSPIVCKMFKFLVRKSCEDFNVNVKDNYNSELVEFMNDTFELDVLSDLSQGTTRSGSCIDMVFGRNVVNLSRINFASYFSYHRPILITTNHQAPQLTNVSTN